MSLPVPSPPVVRVLVRVLVRKCARGCARAPRRTCVCVLGHATARSAALREASRAALEVAKAEQTARFEAVVEDRIRQRLDAAV
eukprot:731529-Pleurochrysis_carterae.AAC.1